MVKNYTSKSTSENLKAQLSLEFSSLPIADNVAPSDQCINNILAFSAALEVRHSRTTKPFLVIRN